MHLTAPLLTTLESLPRAALVSAPTPLEPAHCLSEVLGTEIWFKRDDLTGRGMGGNKVRTLEHLLGDALVRGHDSLVTGAGTRSNWAMLAALTARTVGLEPHVVYYGSPRAAAGNQMLAVLAGAHLRWTGDPARESVDPAIERVAAELRTAGRSPYVVPRGGATPLGCLGYVHCALELSSQWAERGLDPGALWLASGSCGTQAGLVAGMAVLGLSLPVVGVATSRSADESVRRVDDLAGRTLELLGMERSAHPATVLDGFIGSGYGVCSEEAGRAIELVARTEGIFLDPVFGAKAMAALVSRAKQRRVTGPVVFLVSGGAPTLFNGIAGRA